MRAAVEASRGTVKVDRVERLLPWFALQLEFADVFAARAGIPLAAAITFYTNLHRRFGFGRPAANGHSPAWSEFVGNLTATHSQRERIELTGAFAQTRLKDWRGATEHDFGCFGFDAPVEGVVRIHFNPNDNTEGVGPLSRLKRARRIGELADMFAFIRREHGSSARYVAGGSWLYNLEAYRRLFPPAYIASLQVHTAPSNLSGGSWWGQFVDHEENTVAERVSRFRDNLGHLNAAEAWRVFPLPAMTARVAIGAFHEHYAHHEGN